MSRPSPVASGTTVACPCAPRAPARISQGSAAGVVLAALPLLLAPAFVSVRPPGTDLELMPESERPFRQVVIGLDPMNLPHFMVPGVPALAARRDPDLAGRLRRQLFQLRLALDHGGIFACAPPDTTFFVAVPDPTTAPGATGTEAQTLRDYLTARVGWSPERVAEHIRVFMVPEALPYPQDMAEALGFDHRGRLVLAIGEDIDRCYLGGVRSLVRTYPEDFVLRTLGETGAGAINAEGGDLALVWLPEGRVGVLVGRHRIVRFLEHRYGTSYSGEAIPQPRIEEARRAFSAAFFGREVVIVGEEALRHPGWVNDDVFHADMVVVVLRCDGRVVAFVPTFEGHPVDAITGASIAAEQQRLVQREYDLVARQLETRGFTVVRLPFSDHPVRNPVNVSRFLDPTTHQPVVLLPSYPYHDALASGGESPKSELEAAFDAIDAKVTEWTQSPDQSRWAAVQGVIEAAWGVLRTIAARRNPLVSEQAARYEASGVRVLTVPMYPNGEGSLHCLILR
jgi:hypothetical protein